MGLIYLFIQICWHFLWEVETSKFEVGIDVKNAENKPGHKKKPQFTNSNKQVQIIQIENK